MRFFYLLLYTFLLVALTGCRSKPNNLCECLEQAFVLQKKKDHRLEKNLKTEGVDQEINQLKKHCHHLAWRGSSCSVEETTRIIENKMNLYCGVAEKWLHL